MDDGIFVAFLFNVDKNCATVGLGGSKCEAMLKDDPTVDIRTLTLIPKEACNDMMEGLDRGLPPVTTWQQLYTWLGRGHGWAYFTPESAGQLLPHWFGSTEYKCQQNLVGGLYRAGPFFDVEVIGGGIEYLASADEMSGPDAEGIGRTARLFNQFGDNFIITKRPIFMV